MATNTIDLHWESDPNVEPPNPVSTVDDYTRFDGDAVLDDPWGAYGSSGPMRRNTTAAVALMAIAAVAGIAIGAMILTGARRRADPARFAVPWLKASSVFLALSILMALISYAIVLYLLDNDPAGYTDAVSGLAMSGYHTNLLWELFDFVAQPLLLVALASVAVGAHSLSRGGVAGFLKMARWAVLFMFAVITALAIAVYGMRVAVHASSSPSWDLIDLVRAADKTATATSILIWLTALAVAGLSVFAMGSGTRTTGILLAAANLLNVLGATWNMAYYIRWRLEYRFVPFYVPVLHAVLQMWTTLAVLAICFLILRKRAGGLWTVGAYGDQGHGAPKPSRSSAGMSSLRTSMGGHRHGHYTASPERGYGSPGGHGSPRGFQEPYPGQPATV